MDSECDTDGSWERKNVAILPATRRRPRTKQNSRVALVPYVLTAVVCSEVSSGQHTTVSEFRQSQINSVKDREVC